MSSLTESDSESTDDEEFMLLETTQEGYEEYLQKAMFNNGLEFEWIYGNTLKKTEKKILALQVSLIGHDSSKRTWGNVFEIQQIQTLNRKCPILIRRLGVFWWSERLLSGARAPFSGG